MENKVQSSLVVDTANRSVLITRIFDAPRDLVYKIVTDPGLIPQWWGPRAYTTRVEKMELHPGGVWRYIQNNVQGEEFAFNGVYSEIVPQEKLVYTFNFEPMPGHEVVETVTFEDIDGGKTKVTTRDVYQSLEDLEGMIKSGMETGVNESNERLTELIETHRVRR
jgi:uncharacterized protein YndB with AHSA1/START domain